MISQRRKTPVAARSGVEDDTMTRATKSVSNDGQTGLAGRLDIEMPCRAESGQAQLYSLFPARKGRSRRSPEKQCRADMASDWRSRRTNPQGSSSSFFEDVHRAQGRQSQPRDLESTEMKWPELVSGTKAVKVNDQGHESDTRNMSFAEMLKQQPAKTVPSRPASEILKEIKEDLKVAAKTVKKEDKRNRNEVKTRQTKPCLTKVVLNQISASTYGRIGRSDDVSKYVMSGKEEGEDEDEDEKKKKHKPVQVRHELEVEFRELELQDDSEDDFEVEFSTSAPASRASKNIVNKISAMTFQQIGKTSEQSEKYVMKPTKSWSSVVGKGLRPSERGNVKSAVTKIAVDSSDDEKPRGEMNPYDKIRAKLKDGKEELTPEEREIVRVKRRERRKREKENKKREKEEERRKAMLAPQTSKLHFISKEALAQMNQGVISSVRHPAPGKGIKFQDEEYPDLELAAKSSRKIKVISKEIRDESGRLCSDRESNSEWETDDEKKVLLDNKSEEKIEASDIQIVSQTGPISYSSILKTKSVADDAKTKENLVTTAAKIKEEPQSKKITEPEKKKVKKKDPIEFDIFSAINVKRPQTKKSSAVLGGKIKKEGGTKPVMNPLDSSAPSRKRGKERESGKKKKKTLLKKIILEERLKKKLAREAAEKRRQNRIEAGVFLKPLPVQDEDVHKPTGDPSDSKGNISKDEENKKETLTAEEENIEDPDRNVLEEEKEQSVEEKAKAAIHSRKFRSYCNQLLTVELDTLVSSLMTDLIRFQDRQHAKDPVKAKARRRYVVGLREAAKFLQVKKVVCLVLAPDLEQVETKGGLDDAVTKLMEEAAKQDPPIPVVFGLNRRKLGRACLRKVSVSCIGVMNPQGADAAYQAMLDLSASLSEQYKERLSNEISLLTSPPPVVASSPAPSAVSVLSEHAPAFVPSWEQYPQYQPQYDPQYLGYGQYQYCTDYTDYTSFTQPWQQPY